MSEVMMWSQTTLLFLAAVFVLGHVTVSDACSPTDDPSDATLDSLQTHIERVCLNDFVFRGRITNTVTTDEFENIVVTTTFRVLEYFRDTTQAHELNLDIEVAYFKEMMCCRAEPFDLSQDTILVFSFALGPGQGFTLPCEGHLPYDQVPQALFDEIANNNPCGDGGFIGGPVEQPDGTLPPSSEESTAASSYTSLPTLTIFPFVSEVQCPEDGQDGVVVDAQVNLTGVDPDSIFYRAQFEHSDRILLCQVDLTTCPGASDNLCYCVQQSGEVYTIRLHMTADLSYSDVEVKVIILDSNLTDVVATSNSSNYPAILDKIVQSLRTDNKAFYLDSIFDVLDISEEETTANLVYDVSGLNSPYQITIQPIPGGPTFVSDDGPLTSVAVDLNYTGLTLSYREMNGPCARNYSQTYTFSAAASVMNANFVTLTPFVIGLAILMCSLRWTN